MNNKEIRNVSISRLSKFGISVPDHLPFIEDYNELKPQSEKAVFGKICSLGYIIGMGYTKETNKLIDLLTKYSLWPSVTPYQKERLENPNKISKKDENNFKMLAESVYALAWCINVLPIDYRKGCPENLAKITIPGNTPDNFIIGKKLRTFNEIYSEADFCYCLHWYEKECQLNNKNGILKEWIIRERRRAIDWVIGVAENWDNLESDT